MPQNGKGRLPVPEVSGMLTTCERAMRCDRADRRLTNEVYADCLVLLAQWGLDAAVVTVELERLVRRLRV